MLDLLILLRFDILPAELCFDGLCIECILNAIDNNFYEFLRDKVYVFYTYVQVCFDGLCTEKCNSRQLISEDSSVYDEVDDRECSSGTDVCLDGLCRDTCQPGQQCYMNIKLF